MTVAPLFAQALPPAPSPARPAQGDGPSDLAGLFALLLAGAPLVQAAVARGADPGAPAAPGLAPALAGDFPPAVPAAPSAQQPTPGFRRHRAGRMRCRRFRPCQPDCGAGPGRSHPGQRPAAARTGEPGCIVAGPVCRPERGPARAAPPPSRPSRAAARTQTPGAAAPAPLTDGTGSARHGSDRECARAAPGDDVDRADSRSDGAGGAARPVAPDRRRPRGPIAGRAARCARWRLQAPGRWPRRRPRLVGRTVRFSRRTPAPPDPPVTSRRRAIKLGSSRAAKLRKAP